MRFVDCWWRRERENKTKKQKKINVAVVLIGGELCSCVLELVRCCTHPSDIDRRFGIMRVFEAEIVVHSTRFGS